MFQYFKLIFLFSILSIVLCTKNLTQVERVKKFTEYQEALRSQMRPDSLSDTILLIHKLDKAIESDPKDWDWKLRDTNVTLTPNHHDTAEEDAISALAKMKKYNLLRSNSTTISPDNLKDFEHKFLEQRKLYKKTLTKYERPVLQFQTRRQRRRKLRQEIAQKLFGTGGTCTIQISVLQIPIIVIISVFKMLN